MHRLQEMVRLHRQGLGPREVARKLEMSPTTERKYRNALEPAGLLAGSVDDLPAIEEIKAIIERALGEPQCPPKEVSTVEAYRDEIAEMLERGAQPTAIWDRLRLEQNDFTGSLSAVKRMCLRLKAERGPRPEDIVLRVETAPGDVCQVDFGYVGKLFDPDTGRVRKAYAFVMVLGFSRLMYVDLVFDQKLGTWIDQHRRAFDHFGAVPQTVVPDNLKAAVMRCYFGFAEKPSSIAATASLSATTVFGSTRPAVLPAAQGEGRSRGQKREAKFLRATGARTDGGGARRAARLARCHRQCAGSRDDRQGLARALRSARA